MTEDKGNILGSAKISHLLLKFSVPTVMTLMVNCLYNIVDQIFIGHAAGVSGIAATNAAFPMVTISAALALMVGDGTASNISLCLGRKEREEAERTLGNGVTLLFLSALVLVAAMLLGGTFFARIFGASEAVLADSVVYLRILALGLPFQMSNMAFTAIIRSDGNPKYAMKSMMLGAGMNVVLDPIFIFLLDLGVSGAAIATILGQMAAGIICIAYLPKFEHISFRRENMRLRGTACGRILALGFPSCCMQTATALTQIVMNNLMRNYGAMTIYGSEIALSCYGIMMKIYQVAHAMFVGVASGTQPINGYNYGAKQYRRVRRTFRVAVTVSFVISFVWFGIFQLGGGLLAGLFVEEEPLYLEFAVLCFHVYMMGFFVYGLPQVTASFFQAIGKPGKSLLTALSRQAIFLIPLSLALSSRYGLMGALWAAPAADMLAFLLAGALIFHEFRGWKDRGW